MGQPKASAGELRHIAEVWQPVDSITIKGDDEITYSHTDGDDEYCSIEPLAGREILFARQIRGDLTHKIVMRYRDDITHRTQLRWDNGTVVRQYNLGPMVDVESRNVMVSFYAIEIK